MRMMAWLSPQAVGALALALTIALGGCAAPGEPCDAVCRAGQFVELQDWLPRSCDFQNVTVRGPSLAGMGALAQVGTKGAAAFAHAFGETLDGSAPYTTPRSQSWTTASGASVWSERLTGDARLYGTSLDRLWPSLNATQALPILQATVANLTGVAVEDQRVDVEQDKADWLFIEIWRPDLSREQLARVDARAGPPAVTNINVRSQFALPGPPTVDVDQALALAGGFRACNGTTHVAPPQGTHAQLTAYHEGLHYQVVVPGGDICAGTRYDVDAYTGVLWSATPVDCSAPTLVV